MELAFASMVAPATVRLERRLPGPIERVWAFLTEADKRGQWLASGDMEQRVGGRVDLCFDNSKLTGNDEPPPPKYARHAGESHLAGRITDCDPPNLLAFDWGSGEHPSHVRFELTSQGDEVLLRIVHSRLPDREQMLSVAGGWHTHVGILDARLRGVEPEGFWKTHTRLEAEYDKRLPAW